jgi:fatty acid-binding protein DegV
MDEDIIDDMNDIIEINNLISYLEQCVANGRVEQAKKTIDRIIRLLQILKFNLDIMDE